MAGPAFGTNVGQDFTFLTDIDLTNDQFLFVVLGSDGYVDIAGAGVRALGILQSNELGSVSTPKGCTVRTAGTSKVVAGGTFNAGDLLSVDSSGRAVKYTAGSVYTGTPYTLSGTQVVGIAVEPGVVTGITTILFQPSGLSA